MKNTPKTWTLALVALVAGFAQAEHYKVFILGGQSNMYGADSKLEALPEDLQQRQEDVLLYSGSEFSRLKPGSGRVFGPEVTFGRAIADALPRENFYLIKHSDGGTSLWNEWNLEDGRSYTRLKHVVEIALEALTRSGHSYEIVGILWTQGERDAWNLRTTAQYEADLQALIADMRSRWGEDLPFFFSRLSLLQTARPVEAVRTAQEYVAAADPKAHLIDTDGMEMQKDNLHFTGQGYIDLGHAYAQAYLNTLEGDPQSAGPTELSGTGDETSTKAGGVIDGEAIIVSSSDGSLSFSTFDQKGHPAWHPNHTVDGSGLENGEHGSGKNAGWMTERIDPSDSFIQWDLGASYELESIHVWNLKVDDDTDAGIRTADVYVSNVAFPGDPEGAEAANWIRLGDGPVEFPRAPATGTPNTGFDLATVAGTPLPGEGVRYVRFEVNRNWKGERHRTGLAEIRFTAESKAAGPSPRSPKAVTEKPDSTAPRIKFVSPPREATEIRPGRDLILVFDEHVVFGSGKIHLRRSDGTPVQSFDVGSPGSGLDLTEGTLTIDPAEDLEESTTYSVEVDATAIVDLAGNPFAGFGGDEAWSFTTVVPDRTAPVIASLVPPPGTDDFFPADNLVITFSENIGFGSGAIHIRRSDGTVVESFDVDDPPDGLTYLGDTITINPVADLPLGTDLYVEIEGTAIRDNSGNAFLGTRGAEAWSFATPATAKYATITYVDTQFDIESPEDDPGVGWRNPSPPKPLDVDGDHILGTDGWRVGQVGNAVSDPPYATTAQVAPNANAHGRWDDPLDPAGKDTTQGVLHDAKANAGETSAPLVTFEITEEIPEGEVLRVGVLFDVMGGPNTATYTLRQTFGGTATATTPVHEWTGKGLDVAFFDLTDLRPGYTFEVTCTTISTSNHPGPFEQVVGITFDTGVPRSGGRESK
ncbi:sialate O-acetylesterase [Haloferula sp. A504]|uniref:sialate O-acetylesterase n=1 Tax=Haloferula sp. A504 TaxID=3373601 RepID=UPI0031C78C75|nr:Ig-like domain-containing protein [Verrucomicrobiaceae bacterium E54]